MSDAEHGQLTADAAEVYEEFFVPALFGQFVEPMLDAAAVGVADRVLDVGCGTGVVARGAAVRSGPRGEVIGIDPNEGMLAVAGRVAPSLQWRSATAEDLPFDDDSFDRVLSQFALMFFSDRTRALSEMARVAAPQGTVTVGVWSPVTESPGYDAMVKLLDRLFGSDAADALRAPFVLGQPDVLEGLVSPFMDDVRVRRVEGTARFESVEAWVHTDVRGWTLAEMIDDAGFARLLEAARIEMAPFVSADGSVAFPAPALVATGRPAAG